MHPVLLNIVIFKLLDVAALTDYVLGGSSLLEESIFSFSLLIYKNVGLFGLES